MGITYQELKRIKKNSIVLEKQENIEIQQNSKGFYQKKSSLIKEKFYGPAEKQHKDYQKERSKKEFPKVLLHSLILEKQEQQELVDKIHGTSQQLADLEESINHEIAKLQPPRNRLIEENNEMERKKYKEVDATWADHLADNSFKESRLKRDEIAKERFSLKHQCVCTSPHYSDDKNLAARPRMRDISYQIVANDECLDEGAVGDHNSALNLKENKFKKVKSFNEELMVSDPKIAVQHDPIVNCCYGLTGQPQCQQSRLNQATNCAVCHLHNYQRAGVAGNREYNYCRDEYYYNCGNCNCNTQCATRCNTAAGDAHYRRRSTDLNTQHFYCRPEERTASPEPRSNSKSKKKSKSYKSKESYDEYNESKKRECDERLEKLKERTNKRQRSKSTDANEKRSNKQERLSKLLIKYLDRYVDDHNKELTFKKNKESKAPKISEDSSTSTTVKVRSESKICQVTVRKKQIDTKNTQELHEYNDHDSQDTQYSLETLRMLKKMTIREYKAVKPQEKKMELIRKEEQKFNAEKENKQLEKVKRYQEYLKKYKREQEAKNSIKILKQPPLVFSQQESEEAEIFKKQNQQSRNLENPMDQMQTSREHLENFAEQFRIEVPENESPYSVQSRTSYEELRYEFGPTERVIDAWDDYDKYREEKKSGFKEKTKDSEEYRQKPALIQDNVDIYRESRDPRSTTEYKRKYYKDTKRPTTEYLSKRVYRGVKDERGYDDKQYLTEFKDKERRSDVQRIKYPADKRQDSVEKRQAAKGKESEDTEGKGYDYYNEYHAAKRTGSGQYFPRNYNFPNGHKVERNTDYESETYRDSKVREQQSKHQGDKYSIDKSRDSKEKRQPLSQQPRYREHLSGRKIQSNLKESSNQKEKYEEIETLNYEKKEPLKLSQYLEEVESNFANEISNEALYSQETIKRQKLSATDPFKYEVEERVDSARSSLLKDHQCNIKERNIILPRIYGDKADNKEKEEVEAPPKSSFQEEIHSYPQKWVKPKDNDQSEFDDKNHKSNSSSYNNFKQEMDQNLGFRSNRTSQMDHNLQFRTDRSSQTEYNFTQEVIEPKATKILNNEEKTPEYSTDQNELREELREVTQQHETNMENTSLIPLTTESALKYLKNFFKTYQQSELDGECLNSVTTAANDLITKLSSCKSLPQTETTSEIDLKQHRKSTEENSVETLEEKLTQDTQYKDPESTPDSSQPQLRQQIKYKESRTLTAKTPRTELKSPVVIQRNELEAPDKEEPLNKYLQQETYRYQSQTDLQHKENSETYQKYVECEENFTNLTTPQHFEDDQRSPDPNEFGNTAFLSENQQYLPQDSKLPSDCDPKYCEPCVESQFAYRPGRQQAFDPALVPLKGILKPCRAVENSELVAQDLECQRTTSVVSFGHKDYINIQTDSAMTYTQGQEEIAQQYHETRETIITKDEMLRPLRRHSKHMLTELTTTKQPIYQGCQPECESQMVSYTADNIPHLYTVEMPTFKQCPCMWDIYMEMLTNYYKTRKK